MSKATPTLSKTQQNLGHRSRVRKKFLSSQGQTLSDYELLEILLFSSIPRKDTKKIAKDLIQKFGDISSVIKADIENLKEIAGLGESSLTQIKIISNIIEKTLKQDSLQKKVLNNWQDLLNYVFAAFYGLNHEVFRVLFLDKKHQLIEDELIKKGENDHVNISSKEIVKKALLLSASSIILLHNHPSGNLNPSNQDIQFTNEMVKILKNLEIKVLDHLIVFNSNYFSFKEQNLL